MDDSTYTFIQHQRETKSIARGAKAKRNGSRSKKCTLPSDRLTPAQKKGLNGPMQTYDMNKPHTLRDLKLWPADLRHEYMRNIIDKYQPSNYMIADMLGCAKGYVSTLLPRYFGISRTKGYRPAKDQATLYEWAKFMGRIPSDPLGDPDPSPLPDVTSWPGTIGSMSGPTRYETITVRFKGTADDLLRVVQTGPLHLTGADTYTFTITAARKED